MSLRRLIAPYLKQQSRLHFVLCRQVSVGVPWACARSESNRDIVYGATACSTNCILFSCLQHSLCPDTCVRASSKYFSRVPWTHLDIARLVAYKLVSTLFNSNKFLIVSYLRRDKKKPFVVQSSDSMLNHKRLLKIDDRPLQYYFKMSFKENLSLNFVEYQPKKS